MAVMARAMASNTSEQVVLHRDSSREKRPAIKPRKSVSGSCSSAPAKRLTKRPNVHFDDLRASEVNLHEHISRRNRMTAPL